MNNPKRFKFVIDTDAVFEESNGESRALTEQEYKDNEYRACPTHTRSKVPPRRTHAGRAWCGECGKEYVNIPYAEYLAYYGNPDRHVYLGMIVDEQCECCQQWKAIDSLWSIDFMDDSPEYRAVTLDKWYTMEDARKLPGYLGDLVKEHAPRT